MKKPIVVLFLLLSVTFQSYGNALTNSTNPESDIEFLIAGVEDIKSFAEAERKFILMHFTASWCMPCQWMETNTYKDSDLVRYVNSNFLAKKIDIDNFEGRRLQKKYDVHLLPSVLIFSPEGKLMDRVDEALEAEKLLLRLQQFNKDFEGHLAVEAPKENFIDPPSIDLGALKISAPSLDLGNSNANDPAERYERNTISAPSLEMPSTSYQEPAVAAQPERQPTVYMPSSYYTIQVGAFSTHENAKRFVKENKSKTSQVINIKPSKRSKGFVYLVQIGQFANELEADRYENTLKKLGMNTYVKKIDNP